MPPLSNLTDVVRSDLCLGCGMCTINAMPGPTVRMRNSAPKGHAVPESTIPSANANLGFEVCPGKGYKIQTLAGTYGLGPSHHKDIGYFTALYAVTGSSPALSKNAASSGVISIVIKYLLDKRLIDRAVVTRFEYTNDGPRAMPFLAQGIDDLMAAQGSKYCPVNFDKVLEMLRQGPAGTRSAFVGTPCQIASIRYIQTNIADLGIKYFIGGFCGGFKDYRNLDRLIKIAGMHSKDVTEFRFRGGGQPGTLRVASGATVTEIAYPEYVKMTGYNKMLRCHLCVDATAELADIACGDAWLPEILQSGVPTSIAIIRNDHARRLIEEIAREGHLALGPISTASIIQSQIGNIETKKYRQAGRLKLYRLLGHSIPELDEGYDQVPSHSLLFEVRVWISHKMKLLAEKCGIFYCIYYKSTFVHRLMLKLFSDIYN